MIVLAVVVLIAAVAARTMRVYPIALHLHAPVFQQDGHAINGFDVVAFHTSGEAIKGETEFSTNWNNATWLFGSGANLALFEKQPEKYAPKVGGYCTFAVSKGMTAPGNGNFWHISEGKLYLFSNEAVKRDALEDFENISATALKNLQ